MTVARVVFSVKNFNFSLQNIQITWSFSTFQFKSNHNTKYHWNFRNVTQKIRPFITDCHNKNCKIKKKYNTKKERQSERYKSWKREISQIENSRSYKYTWANTHHLRKNAFFQKIRKKDRHVLYVQKTPLYWPAVSCNFAA